MRMISKALCVLSGAAVLSTAVGFEFEYGEVTGTLKNKISIGATIRTEDNNDSLLGKLNVEGQQALCDPGGGIDYAPLANIPQTVPGDILAGLTGLPLVDGLDPIGACVLSGFGTFVNAAGSYTAHAFDNGKLNYDEGDVVAAAAKVVTDFSVTYNNFSFVSQIISVTDPVNTDFDETHPNSFFTCAENLDDDPNNDSNRICGAQPRKTPREKGAEDSLNQVNLRIAYAEMQTEYFDRTQVFRIGKQTIRWGESLAVPLNSINTINAVNPIRLFTPGFSLDELYDPTNALVFNTGLTENVLMEAFYQLEWDPVQINAPGTFNSPSDVIGVGNGRAAASLGLGFAREDPSNLFDRPRGQESPNIADFGRDCFFDRNGDVNPDDLNGTLNQGAHRGNMEVSTDEQGRPGLRPVQGANPLDNLLDNTGGRQACLASTRTADDSGQWGLRFNWFAENINNGSEIGFYYLNYHSRLPYLSVYSTQLPATDGNASGEVLAAAVTALSLGAAPSDQIVDVVGALQVVDTLRAVIDYPEDISLFGISASTNVGPYSVSMEYSYRPDLPLQVAPTDVLFYGQAPAFGRARCYSVPSQLDQYRNGDYTEFSTIDDCPAVSNAPGEFIKGYESFPVGQGEMTILSLAETNPFLADTWIRIMDIGFTKVFGLPDVSDLAFSGGFANSGPLPGRRELDEDENGEFDGIRSDGGANGGAGNGDGTSTAANNDNALAVLNINPEQEDPDAFGTSFAWGYRFINVLTYERVLSGTLEMTFAFFHDVNGTTPGPATNFIKDRKQVIWQNIFKKGSYAFGATYAWQTGAGRRNFARDQDTFTVSAGYTF